MSMTEPNAECFIKWHITGPIVAVSCLALLVWLLYRYLAAYYNESSEFRVSKKTHYLQMCYGIMEVLVLILSLAHMFLQCKGDYTPGMFFGFYYVMGNCAYCLCLLLLYLRVYTTLESTQFALSKSHQILFKVLYSFVVVTAVFTVFVTITSAADVFALPRGSLQFLQILYIAFFVSIVVINMLLLYLFASNLLTISRNVGGRVEDDVLIPIISKASVLTWTSIWTSIVSGALFIGLNPDSIGYRWLFVLMVGPIDHTANFLSVFLGLQIFESLYMRLCKCCDRRIRKRLEKCTLDLEDQPTDLETASN